MAKKIRVSFPEKAKQSLRKYKIEHVCVTYHRKDNTDDVFLVVMNKDFHNAISAIKADNGSVIKTKSVRHYEMLALKHEHYQPTFECKCRYCNKTFNSYVKQAVWCSKKCKKEFRLAKKQSTANY